MKIILKDFKFLYIGSLIITIVLIPFLISNSTFYEWVSSGVEKWYFWAVATFVTFAVGFISVKSRYITYYLINFNDDVSQNKKWPNSSKNGKVTFSISNILIIISVGLSISISINYSLWLLLLLFIPFFQIFKYRNLYIFINHFINRAHNSKNNISDTVGDGSDPKIPLS